MEALSPRGTRTIAARDFFAGLWTTSLEPDELLAGLSFPVWGDRCGFAVEEVARRHGDFAIAGAVVGVELDDHDRVRRCAVGLLGLGSTPVRADAAEAAATGVVIADVDPAAIGRTAVAGLGSVPSDLHGSAAYRTHVGAVTVARAWARAAADAAGAEGRNG
jgi:carbon-monoxide dehydrogenase medium subunit